VEFRAVRRPSGPWGLDPALLRVERVTPSTQKTLGRRISYAHKTIAASCSLGHLSAPPHGPSYCRKPLCRKGVRKLKIFKQTTWSKNSSRDSVVGIATGYRLDDLGIGVRVPVRSRIFSPPNRPERLWGPSNLLSNVYRGLFLGFKVAGA
jgi:hypothetical protein